MPALESRPAPFRGFETISVIELVVLLSPCPCRASSKFMRPRKDSISFESICPLLQELFGLVYLRCQVRAASSIRVVEKHQRSVPFPDQLFIHTPFTVSIISLHVQTSSETFVVSRTRFQELMPPLSDSSASRTLLYRKPFQVHWNHRVLAVMLRGLRDPVCR